MIDTIVAADGFEVVVVVGSSADSLSAEVFSASPSEVFTFTNSVCFLKVVRCDVLCKYESIGVFATGLRIVVIAVVGAGGTKRFCFLHTIVSIYPSIWCYAIKLCIGNIYLYGVE